VAGVGVAAGATISGQPAKGRTLVRIDPRYLRPTEVATLLGDPSEAPAKLGWSPSISFESLVEETVEAQLREAERERLVKSSGYPIYSRVVGCTTNDESELHCYCLRITPKADSPATRPSI